MEVSLRGAGGSGLCSLLVSSLSLLWLAFSRRASSSRWPLAFARQSITTPISDRSSSSLASVGLSGKDVTSLSSNSPPGPLLTSSGPFVWMTGWTVQLELRRTEVRGPPSFFISMAPEDMSGTLSCSFDQSTMRKPLERVASTDKKKYIYIIFFFFFFFWRVVRWVKGGSQIVISGQIWFWTWSIQIIYPIKEVCGVCEVSVKDKENSALWGKTCNKAHTAVALQSLCSCRCFGSKTSKFSIHCLVLKVSWQKRVESMLFQKWKTKKNAWRTWKNTLL